MSIPSTPYTSALTDPDALRFTPNTPTYYADQAWKKYNTKRLIDFANPPEPIRESLADPHVRQLDEADRELRSEAISIMRQLFYDAFLMGLHYKITKEIDEQHNVA